MHIHIITFFACIISIVSCNATIKIPTIVLIPEIANPQQAEQTLQFAKELKQFLTLDDAMRVIITKVNHNKVAKYQACSLANRLKATLVLTLSISKNDETKPSLGIYYRSLNKLSEIGHNKKTPLELLPITTAHHTCILATKKLATDFYTLTATADNLKIFNVYKPMGLPLKNNTGLIVPSFCLDLATDGKISLKPIFKIISATIKNSLIS